MVNGVLAWGWGGGVVAGAGVADEGVDGAGGVVGQGSPDGDLVHVFVVEGLDVEGVAAGAWGSRSRRAGLLSGRAAAWSSARAVSVRVRSSNSSALRARMRVR
jgi:hypothetical protein